MKKTTKELVEDEEYAKMFGMIFLFFIDEMEKKNKMNPELQGQWFIEHPTDEEWCFEVLVAKLPKSHPDVYKIIEPSKWREK